MGGPLSRLDTFFSELERRHVVRVLVVYAVVGLRAAGCEFVLETPVRAQPIA